MFVFLCLLLFGRDCGFTVCVFCRSDLLIASSTDLARIMVWTMIPLSMRITKCEQLLHFQSLDLYTHNKFDPILWFLGGLNNSLPFFRSVPKSVFKYR
jgi:hypothetical protein